MVTRYKDAASNYLAIGGKYFSVKFELTYDGNRRNGLYILVKHVCLNDKTRVKYHDAWLPFGF